MKTRCPGCQTTFRVTPEQLKARAGKVRCGQCQKVFNALDSLIEESVAAAFPVSPAAPDLPQDFTLVTGQASSPSIEPEPIDAEHVTSHSSTESEAISEATATLDGGPIDILLEPTGAPENQAVQPMSEAEAQELGKATGLIMPRELTDVPGYSKWSAGVMAASVTPPLEKPARWPFVLVALALILGLLGQAGFHFRSELAITLPALRPALEELSRLMNADIPLPRHVDLVTIEASDLQSDPSRGNLLVLNATVRNRAAYDQAYPSLELSLTDTQDNAIARRVFLPAEYLPAKLNAGQTFAANSDIAVRLWIEAKDITAAGYRLYVFYP